MRRNAREVGRQTFGDAIDKIVLLWVAADIGEWQDDHRETRGAGFFGRWGRGELRVRRLPDFDRIDTHRFGDVLELRWSEITNCEIEPPLYLTIGVLGETDRARLGDALQPRGSIDYVANSDRRRSPPRRCRHECRRGTRGASRA